ncbi:MAG: hypothetical protein ACYDAY_00185 [Candidatus Dormibacteria bacterium]
MFQNADRATSTCTVLAVIVGGMALGSAAPAPVSASMPVLAGTNTFTWHSDVGITVWAPKPLDLMYIPNNPGWSSDSQFTLHVTGGTYAYMLISQPGYRCGSYSDCQETEVIWVTDMDQSGQVDRSMWRDGGDYMDMGVTNHLQACLANVYLLTDAQSATITFKTQLTGSLSLAPTTPVAGWAERISNRCSPQAPECGSPDAGPWGLEYGGDEHDLGRMGSVLNLAFSGSLDGALPDSNGIAEETTLRYCDYPTLSDPSESADPSRHPLGCDVTPSSPSSPNSDLIAGLSLAAEGGTTPFDHYQCLIYPGEAGPWYQGFRDTHAGPFHVDQGLWSVWVPLVSSI